MVILSSGDAAFSREKYMLTRIDLSSSSHAKMSL
jgi:hypothetical protein